MKITTKNVYWLKINSKRITFYNFYCYVDYKSIIRMEFISILRKFFKKNIPVITIEKNNILQINN